ncbi:MAG: hypothetical protein R3F20_11395 [Planctomycetota bacterium]
MTAAAPATQIPRVCQSCKFGAGAERDCTLLQAGRLETLLEEGPCGFRNRVRLAVERTLAENFREARSLAPLVTEKSTFRLQLMEDFPGDALARLPDALVWLDRFVLNFAADVLAPRDEIPGLRCGRCRHFDASEGLCNLEIGRGPDGRRTPHVWYREYVAPTTDPRQMTPACDGYEGVSAADRDPFAGVLDGIGTARATQLVMAAVDRLAETSTRGMAQAVLVVRHGLKREPLEDVATAARLDLDTARRLFDSGMAEVRKLLADHIDELDPERS